MMIIVVEMMRKVQSENDVSIYTALQWWRLGVGVAEETIRG